MCTPTQGVWQPAGCVSCELVCVCVSLVRVVIICLASTHTALVSSPSLTVLHLSTYLRHSPVDEAKRWASGKGRKVGFAKARATFRGGGTGIAATAAKHDSLIKKARWRGTEQIARETPAGSVSVE